MAPDIKRNSKKQNERCKYGRSIDLIIGHVPGGLLSDFLNPP
jgi:hypothetical protein